MASGLVLLMEFLSVQTGVSLHLHLFLVPDLGRFSFCLFVLSYSIVLIFVYFITVPEKTVF